MFIFVIYDVIHRYKAVLGYSFLVELGIWEKTEELIYEITYSQLIAMTTKIKKTNQCTNGVILVLKRYVQTVAAYAPYLYT